MPNRKINRFKQKIQRTTNRRSAEVESVAHKIMAINSIVIGFAEYYRYTNWKALGVPSTLDWSIDDNLYWWLKRKHPKSTHKQIKEKYCP